MPQLDRFLLHLFARGAARLLLIPGEPPVLEMPDGQRLNLAPTPMTAVMVDALASEVMDPRQKASWADTPTLEWGYSVDGKPVALKAERTPGGASLSATMAPAAPPKPAPPMAPAVSASADPLSPPSSDPRKTEMPPGGPLSERLFKTLLAMKGSDLHCTSNHPPIARVHGDMEELSDFGILGPSQMEDLMRGLATPDTWRHFEEVRDADFAYPFEAGGCRFRVNFFMDRQGPGMVVRVIPNEIPDPDQLGIPEPVRRLALLSKGLVLVTGPTGSGKSTTLAAIVDLANRQRKDHIITIEDPIEFVHPKKRCLVNQREVGTHTNGFKNALRAALREDPDIVLVGEMRDLETISIALETAITGHLVFGTLHTSSAIGTIDRIVDQFPADRQQQIRVMLSDALKCVVSQVLLKKKGGGRVAALESLFVGPAIANLIREAKAPQIMSQMQTGRAYGQKLMVDSIVDLVKAGTVDPLEAYLKAPDKDTLIQGLKRVGIAFDPRSQGETDL
ncbi:MAG TPA: PilT/PilU family type 4a pilus ATPase [Holophagaceae bacterium]|jgi:twitching motility protein PilT|nr:PilT/PilU family type 4a pilus ATPase [Holophagaceae bacterium]